MTKPKTEALKSKEDRLIERALKSISALAAYYDSKEHDLRFEANHAWGAIYDIQLKRHARPVGAGTGR